MFNKEIFLLAINNLNDFETIKYIVQNYFLISILIIFFVPLILEIILYESISGKNFWQSIIIGEIVRVLLIVGILIGFMPYFLTL